MVGLELANGARLVAQGTPNRPIRFVPFPVVQEQQLNWGNAPVPYLICGPTHAGVVSPPPPSLTLRFVQFSQPAANGWGCFSQTDWYAFTAQDVRDCQFLNAWNQFWGPWAVANTIEVRNNLFQRSPASFVGCQTLSLYNNLFWGGSNYFKSHQVGFWTIRDNAFHHTVLTDDSPAGSATNSHNAYLGAGQAQLQNSGGNDVVANSFTYATGPYGPWYQASTSLVDRGSQSASAAGLYHETTQADQTQETNSTVDIGFHYVAVDACGQPVDADGDGLPDYAEDANGNGAVDSGETSFTQADTDGDGLSDTEEPLILIDTANPSLGYLDPLIADTGATGRPDGQKDSDHDGISNLSELRTYGSQPSNAHTFNAAKDDAQYLFTAFQFGPNTLAYLEVADMGDGTLSIGISDASPSAIYDLYFVPTVPATWQWRRVLCDIQCDGAGQAMFLLHQPDPYQGYFVVLDATDDDGDGLSNGYESWFNYNGLRTIVSEPDYDVDGMDDGWEVEYGLDPTVATGTDGASGDPDTDGFSNLDEYNNYSVMDGSYDPLKVYNTSANRPIVRVFDSTPNGACETAQFTIERNAGVAGSYASPLSVYYALGGSLNYDLGDYTLTPAPLEWPRIYSVTIPAGQRQATVTISAPGVAAEEGQVETVALALTPYAVSPLPQVADPQDWAYVVDWNNNRATCTFSYSDLQPIAFQQDRVTHLARTIDITLEGYDGCGDPLTFAIVTPPTLGSLSGPPPDVIYTPGTTGMDQFTFKVNDGRRDSAPAPVQITVLPGAELTAAGTCAAIGLQWSVADWAQGFIGSFVVYRSTTPGGPYTVLATLPSTSRGYSDTTVTPGVTYYYVVTFLYEDPGDVNTPIHEAPSNEASASTRPPLLTGPADIAFIVDNTGSMSDSLLDTLLDRLITVLDCIEEASEGDYRLALVTPDNDQVHVRVAFTNANRAAFEAAVQGNLGGDGYGNTEPESTDECLNTAVNALLAAGRVNPRNCTPASQPLQIADFSPGFRSQARKLVVLITDAPPGGFCDEEDGGVQAHQYALQARQACIQINAILVNRDNESPYPAAIPVMQDYYQTSCGWYSNVPHDGGDLTGAILKMFYEDGFCNCP